MRTFGTYWMRPKLWSVLSIGSQSQRERLFWFPSSRSECTESPSGRLFGQLSDLLIDLIADAVRCPSPLRRWICNWMFSSKLLIYYVFMYALASVINNNIFILLKLSSVRYWKFYRYKSNKNILFMCGREKECDTWYESWKYGMSAEWAKLCMGKGKAASNA